jgi:tetratricopeptide (TPR) repeat protein
MLAKLSIDRALIKALSHIKKEEFGDAKKIYKEILQKFPKNIRAQQGLANLNKLNQNTILTKALDQLVFNYNQGQFEIVIEQALSLTKEYPETHFVWNMLGASAFQLGMIEEAIIAYKKAISIKPDYTDAFVNMASALKDKGNLSEAISMYKKAISIKPNYAEAYNNLGLALQDQGDHNEAINAYQKSISLKPNWAEPHYNLSFPLLNNGRVKEGLNEYEWRWKIQNLVSKERFFLKPCWDGRSLDGKKILVWSEQGIGDTINWSSCLSLLSSRAEHCILECQEKLVPLLKRSFPNVEVRPESASLDFKRDDFDFHLPMGSLYKYFIREIIKKQNVDAFLVPDPARVKFWKNRLHSIGQGPYIGVSWKSSILTPWRLQHYPPITEWSKIFTIPNVTFINLQYKDFEDDLTRVQIELGTKIHNFYDLDQFNQIDDVAALHAALDIVVSTKITPAIVSAGVGTLTKIPNWRQSSWNNILLNPIGPSIDMYDRNTWEPWDNVFELISEDIIKIVK